MVFPYPVVMHYYRCHHYCLRECWLIWLRSGTSLLLERPIKCNVGISNSHISPTVDGVGDSILPY